MSDAMARMVIRNALFFGNEKVTNLTVPWCTFTNPELAHVGPYTRDMKKKGINFDTYQVNFEVSLVSTDWMLTDLEDNDRAILDGADEGFVKIFVEQGTDKVFRKLEHNLIFPGVGSDYSRRGSRKYDIRNHNADNPEDWLIRFRRYAQHIKPYWCSKAVIHPYPTTGDAIRRAGDLYNRTKLTTFVKIVFRKLLEVRRWHYCIKLRFFLIRPLSRFERPILYEGSSFSNIIVFQLYFRKNSRSGFDVLVFGQTSVNEKVYGIDHPQIQEEIKKPCRYRAKNVWLRRPIETEWENSGAGPTKPARVAEAKKTKQKKCL